MVLPTEPKVPTGLITPRVSLVAPAPFGEKASGH
jgi:hypothetical protein